MMRERESRMLVVELRSRLDEMEKGLRPTPPGQLRPWRARGYIPAPTRSDPAEAAPEPTGRLAREVMELLSGGTTSRRSPRTRPLHPWWATSDPSRGP
jgi:hypothetical protein